MANRGITGVARAWFQGDRVSMFTSYARQPQYPCQPGQDGWVSGCSGGAGVFGIITDKDYKTSYQFAWASLLVAGFPAEPACAVRLPCIKQTAAEFCVEYGPCPAGETYKWEQQLCAAGAISRRRDCHFTGISSPSLLKHLLKGEEGAAE